MEINLFATLRIKSGKKRLEYEPGDSETIQEVLLALDSLLGLPVYNELVNPDSHTIRPGTMILVDGKNIHHLQGLDTAVQCGKIDVFPPSGGG